MNSFPLHTLETAPPESKPLLASVQQRFGFLPNVYAHLAEAPAVLEALLQLAGIFSRTTLTERQRHILLLASSVENRCTFCVAAHTRGAQAGGVGDEAIASIRDGVAPSAAEDAAVVSFVRALIASRGFVSDADLRLLFDQGFTHRQVLEIVLGITLKILTNYCNHVTHTELNPELASYAWSGPRS